MRDFGKEFLKVEGSDGKMKTQVGLRIADRLKDDPEWKEYVEQSHPHNHEPINDPVFHGRSLSHLCLQTVL
jgi:hypothetical protein